MNTSDRVRRDFSIPVGRAYLYMLAIAVPVTVCLVLVYMAVWGFNSLFDGFESFLRLTSLIPSLVVGVPVHELVHGLSWAYFGKKPLRDIAFGFQVRTLAPYAHLEGSVQASAYRAGTVMPALILGLLPYVIGIGSGQAWFVAFGLLFVFAAGGDMLVLWLIRKVDGTALVEDHPSRAGCYVYESQR
jgi:hypothetical protein